MGRSQGQRRHQEVCHEDCVVDKAAIGASAKEAEYDSEATSSGKGDDSGRQNTTVPDEAQSESGASCDSSEDMSESDFELHPALRRCRVLFRNGYSESYVAMCAAVQTAAGHGLRKNSLPAVLRVPPMPRRRSEDNPPPRRLRLSQAQLIIPRTPSEYLEVRLSRSQSEGLLMSRPKRDFDMVDVQLLAAKAYSEGLLAGRQAVRRSSDVQGEDEPQKPPRRRRLEELREGHVLEGMIVRVTPSGLIIDVGATKTGLLRHRDCAGIQRRFLKKGEVISNLVVQSVDAEQKKLFLQLRLVDGPKVEDLAYAPILRHIASWAKVDLPKDMVEHAEDLDAFAGATPGPEGPAKGGAMPDLKLTSTLPKDLSACSTTASSSSKPGADEGRRNRNRGGKGKGRGKQRR
eukprot:TRINITY_DN91840_c0_g1_i1.p1 TRINITY_DN91840_c0_g1~~TRINITY_DN91840_c0_g1_i1.p1  ORF type:complete len:437 (+),score=85.56 TRINITY_DN91840_c0_g1_i1:103-1311(+)